MSERCPECTTVGGHYGNCSLGDLYDPLEISDREKSIRYAQAHVIQPEPQIVFLLAELERLRNALRDAMPVEEKAKGEM